MWVIFARLDPDPDSESGSRSTDQIESGSDPDTDPQPWKNLPSLVDSTSGLNGRVSSSSEGTWEEPARYTLFLESRRRIPDMTQVYKIIMEKDMVKSDAWFLSVNNAERNKRTSTADPLNLRVQPPRLEVRRHFFSNRVVEDWNRISSWLKSGKTVKSFKNGYAHLRATMVENT